MFTPGRREAADTACEDAPSIPRTMRCRFSGHGSNLATMSARCSLVRPRICRKEAAAAEVSPIHPTAENPSHRLTETRLCVIRVSQHPACPQGTPLDPLWSADLSYPAASTKRNYIHAFKKIYIYLSYYLGRQKRVERVPTQTHHARNTRTFYRVQTNIVVCKPACSWFF